MRLARHRVSANVIYFALYASGLYSFLFWTPIARAADLLTAPLRPALPLAAFAALPFAVRWVVAFVLVDLAAYWAHRAAHANGLLWSFHRLHHSDTKLGPLTTFRCHVVEIAWRMFARALPLHLLAIDPMSMPVGLFFIPLCAEIIAHSDLDWRFGPVVGPAYHRIHHSADIRESQTNFCMLLTIWDVVFRTQAASTTPARYGLPANAGAQ